MPKLSVVEPPKKRSRSKSVGIEDKVVMDRGGLTASVVVAPSNDPTQPLSVVQVRGFFEIRTEPRTCKYCMDCAEEIARGQNEALVGAIPGRLIGGVR